MSPELPPALLTLLLPLKPVLSHNGSVLCRREKDRNPTYRLRYRLSHRHYAIPISTNLAPVLKSLLAAWREEERQHKAEELEAKQAEAEYQRQDRLDERNLISLTGGGRRRKRRLRAMFKEARKQGPHAELELSLNNPCFKPNRTRGRKPRAELTVPYTPQEPFRPRRGTALESSGTFWEQK